VDNCIDAFESGEDSVDTVADIDNRGREARDFASSQCGYIVIFGEISPYKSADQTAQPCHEYFRFFHLVRCFLNLLNWQTELLV
jgi:hypothetical protein